MRVLKDVGLRCIEVAAEISSLAVLSIDGRRRTPLPHPTSLVVLSTNVLTHLSKACLNIPHVATGISSKRITMVQGIFQIDRMTKCDSQLKCFLQKIESFAHLRETNRTRRSQGHII
ncbi:hypothetical protein E2562_028638 [Oryza meyeriana var. granulata]|uniref:Uncharacterized protein n=1 Tax=Oryza meyeriana var. granulata TaxID=110450 RepID=A0A6G1D9J9_9ORYZ|nr:hypothetical protein E2562_028638 [Oryza meyeriana var. granulata]